MPARRPLLLGHRGARRYAPENSIAAFDLALAHGCDGFEFDVRCTADSRTVICHDPRIRRMDVARSAFASLAQNHQLSCLEDVLAGFGARAFLDAEIKVAGIEDAVLAALRQHPPARGYLISSFLPEVIRALHARDGTMPLGFIFDRKSMLPLWRELPVQTLFPHQRLVTAELVQELHGAGKQVMVWTVNRERHMVRLAQWGVDGIISDDTELLCRTLGGSS